MLRLLPGSAMTSNTAAAPRVSARLGPPSSVDVLFIEPGSAMLNMKTALPRTSRPAKSASLPVPAQTASTSRPSDPVPGVPYAGAADPSRTSVVGPDVAVIVHDCGIHCGGRSIGWMRTPDNPTRLKWPASQSADSASEEVPVMRPQNCG